MAIDASAVARVLGIDTVFKDLRGGSVLFLPQRIAVFAQGASAASYSLDKWTATSAGAAGNRYGFGSPIHLILRELMPANGDGVGTIPVTVYPLEDDDSGVPAEGAIVPSGTPTAAGAYRVRVNGILSEQFVIPVGALATAANLTNANREMHDAIAAVLEMPVIPTYVYGTVTSAKTVTIGTSNGTLGTFTTTGLPKAGVWTLVCTAEAANAGSFSVTDPDGVLVGTVTAMGAHVVGGLGFTLSDGAEDFDVGDEFQITVPATSVVLTSKWAGASSNDLYIEVLGEELGVTFTVTQPTGGLVNPDVAAAIAQVGSVWESMAINAQNIEDTTTLDLFQTFGEGRWGELVRKPLVVFTGNTHATLEDATAVSSARRTDRVNSQLVAPGSVNLPCVVAARQLARIAKLANNNPPTDYGALRATGLLPGTDGEQWDYPTRDLAVKAGSSTVEIADGVVTIGDVMTFYRPTGEEPPAYRYVCDIVKLQNVLFNLDLIFAAAEWAGAPLIPDDQPTVNPNARKPKSAKAQMAGLADQLGLHAIISDPKSAKQSIVASINSMNPKRLDASMTVKLSGNSNVKAVTLAFGFFFGTPTVVG